MSTFTGFSQFTRPEIGLLADGSQNLGEIFASDKSDALSSILIRKENLDYIYGLSQVISSEDLRSASGLSALLLPSLHLVDEVLNKKLRDVLEESQQFSSPAYGLGTNALNPSLSGALVRSPNVIIYNGSLQCQGVEYLTNTLGSSLFSNPERRYTSVSVSRTSLFNAEKFEVGNANEGYFKEAFYAGKIRVRRRSHVNHIEIPDTAYLPRPTITENPTHTILLNIDNGNTGTNIPLKLLTTKNTPLKIPCRMGVGSVKFTFVDDNAAYFFGYQVQPTQSRDGVANTSFLPLPVVSQSTGSTSFTLNIDIRSTGYQNAYNLYLYLYVNPEKVQGIEFSGIDIGEFENLRDIGLIGFNNLEVLRLSGTSIKILPLWLKTLSAKLKVLDVQNDLDTYRSGPMGWFDIRDPSALPNSSQPSYTVVSYLTIPKKGGMVNEDGDDWSDPLFRKYILNESRASGTDFRVFGAVTELSLGDKFLGKNVRLDDVFPNLTRLSWNGKFNTDGLTGVNQRLYGTPPKIAKNTGLMRYDISSAGATGQIVDIGTSTIPTDHGHISKYRMEEFRINGSNIGFNQQISGVIGEAGQDWSAWWAETKVINIAHSLASINLQPSAGTWSELQSLSAIYSGGVAFSTQSAPLKAPKLVELNIEGSGSTGQIPTLGNSANTLELLRLNLSRSNGLSSVSQAPSSGSSYNFILPLSFAPDRGKGTDTHKLQRLDIFASQLAGRFRKNDFKFLYNLTNINFYDSPNFTGKFPEVPTTTDPEFVTKQINIYIYRSSFYDLSTLSINSSNEPFSRDFRTLSAFNVNSAGGGVKLPDLPGTINSLVQTIDLRESQPSFYPVFWDNASKREALILDTDPVTELTGLTINRSIYSTIGGIWWTTSDDIYTLTGTGTDYRTKVLVGDSIQTAPNTPELARVLNVSADTITIDRDISGTLPTTVYFKRNTTTISEWFRFGFTELRSVNMPNCRLSGALNIRAGFDKIQDGELIGVDFSNNAITDYISGGLNRIFSGASRKITISLSRNPLSVETVRSVISETISIDRLKRFSNCKVQLAQCKLNSSGKLSTYTQSEIFPTSISPAPDQVISLFRNELIYTYTLVQETDPEGNITTTRVITGTRTVSVPGVLISSLGQYYKTRSNTMQQTVENSLGALYKNLFGIRIDLDFNYSSPNTTPTIVSTAYSNQTTRYGSLIEAGYNPTDLVNP
jgi:hypothetical protein